MRASVSAESRPPSEWNDSNPAALAVFIATWLRPGEGDRAPSTSTGSSSSARLVRSAARAARRTRLCAARSSAARRRPISMRRGRSPGSPATTAARWSARRGCVDVRRRRCRQQRLGRVIVQEAGIRRRAGEGAQGQVLGQQRTRAARRRLRVQVNAQTQQQQHRPRLDLARPDDTRRAGPARRGWDRERSRARSWPGRSRPGGCGPGGRRPRARGLGRSRAPVPPVQRVAQRRRRSPQVDLERSRGRRLRRREPWRDQAERRKTRRHEALDIAVIAERAAQDGQLAGKLALDLLVQLVLGEQRAALLLALRGCLPGQDRPPSRSRARSRPTPRRA